MRLYCVPCGATRYHWTICGRYVCDMCGNAHEKRPQGYDDKAPLK